MKGKSLDVDLVSALLISLPTPRIRAGRARLQPRSQSAHHGLWASDDRQRCDFCRFTRSLRCLRRM